MQKYCTNLKLSILGMVPDKYSKNSSLLSLHCKQSYNFADKLLRQCPFEDIFKLRCLDGSRKLVDTSTYLNSSNHNLFDNPLIKKLVYNENPLLNTEWGNILGTTQQWNCLTTPQVVPILGFKDFPGFVYLPGFISESDQIKLAYECLSDYPKAPNRTNLSILDKTIENDPNSFERHYYWPSSSSLFTENSLKKEKTLFDNLRWVTLGHQYNWTHRTYNGQPYVSLPEALKAIGLDVIESLRHFMYNENDDNINDICHNQHDTIIKSIKSSIKLPEFDTYTPDTAILNLYRRKDRLGGHTDEVEQSMMPLVSVSLGAPGLFLLHNDNTNATMGVVLRCGDVIVLTGESRHVLHGVPRILISNHNKKNTSEIINTDENEPLKKAILHNSIMDQYVNLCNNDERNRHLEIFKNELVKNSQILIETLKSCRLNLSIRQL